MAAALLATLIRMAAALLATLKLALGCLRMAAALLVTLKLALGCPRGDIEQAAAHHPLGQIECLDDAPKRREWLRAAKRLVILRICAVLCNHACRITGTGWV